MPSREFEDEFTGVELDAGLRTCVPVGPFRAALAVSGDLCRVRTTWCTETGPESSRRPAGATKFSDGLEVVEGLRRRLRAHVTALRNRLERPMIANESWTADEWTARMFRDPLRAAMARRLIWHLGRDTPVLALPGADGLRDLNGERVGINPRDRVSLWHPADQPTAQDDWRRRLKGLGVEQPIEQVDREVTLADRSAARLSFAVSKVEQRPFRGFLRSRGWEIPYMGRWFFIGEATRQPTRDGPIAVLDVGLDWESADEAGVIRIGDLGFRSVLGAELDSRPSRPPSSRRPRATCWVRWRQAPGRGRTATQ